MECEAISEFHAKLRLIHKSKIYLKLNTHKCEPQF